MIHDDYREKVFSFIQIRILALFRFCPKETPVLRTLALLLVQRTYVLYRVVHKPLGIQGVACCFCAAEYSSLDYVFSSCFNYDSLNR